MQNWYVIQTKPKKEFQLESVFSQAGYMVYHPKYSQDGLVKPFFPGYLFLRFQVPLEYQKIKYTRGVKKVIGNKNGPIPVEIEIIKYLKSRERNGLIELMKYGEDPCPGDEIIVMEGPLKGLRGIFRKELSDKERVMILLNYVTYQGSLMIEKNKIKKIRKATI
ncbi:MAG: transcription termination/antitermination NusG family protein [Acidobacteriota bacterium]|nr:transcription termination/antitermination NusG family protein [Acidobacteriota bacterium]MDW3228577.1 transcription termination/antitermination NusG family protein [Acidobacteriota bacterium]